MSSSSPKSQQGVCQRSLPRQTAEALTSILAVPLIQLAVVTGAAGVLGEAIARMLVEEEGYIVAAVDRRPEGLEALVQALGRDNVVPFCVDITDHEAVEKACKQIIDRLGPVTILVNNAGILTNDKIAETTADEWDSIFAVNVKGAMLMSQQLLPAMRAQRYGRVVNITSMAAKSGGVTAGTAYAASKGALQSLTFSLAREVSRDGVTVNAIAPAYVKTPMVTEQLTEHQRAQVMSQIPGEILDQNGGTVMD